MMCVVDVDLELNRSSFFGEKRGPGVNPTGSNASHQEGILLQEYHDRSG